MENYNGPERRSAERDESLTRAVLVAVREGLSAHGISDEMHREHHAFMTAWIAEQKRRQERAEKIKATVGGWMVITILGGIGTGVWKAAIYLQEHLK